jgi:hypothetical protein
MTEQEWLTGTDLRDMLAFMKTKRRYTRRTLTLLGAAGCRRLTNLFPGPVCLEAIEAAEAFADRAIDAAQLQATHEGLLAARERIAPDSGRSDPPVPVFPVESINAVHWLTGPKEKDVHHAIGLSSEVLGLVAVHAAGKMPDALPYEAIPDFWSEPEFETANDAARAVESGFLRDIFGNPFRRVRFDKKWRADTALALARQMYESRDFSPMPILADAFQDAGCNHPDVLAHCRSEGPHVRGCWVVDLVLGKK